MKKFDYLVGHEGVIVTLLLLVIPLFYFYHERILTLVKGCRKPRQEQMT